MRKKAILGLAVGVVAGIIDVIPMVLQGLTWDANLSAFTLWVAAGFLTATSALRVHPVLKGILIPFMAAAPCLILIGWKEPLTLIPIAIMTLALGSVMGYVLGRLE